MNCSHISEEECVPRVHADMSRLKESMEEQNLFVQRNGNRGKLRQEETFKTFCSKCDNCSKSWMCLKCGVIFCGRDDLSHALDHFGELEEHNVVLDCITFEIFCYMCDDYVSLPFEPSLYPIIRSLKLLFDREDIVEDEDDEAENEDNSMNTITDEMSNLRVISREKLKKGKKHGKRSKVSPILDPPFQGTVTVIDRDGNQINSRNNDLIKPRGLKNIGNTCFMNSVLQALTSLQSFKDYFISIPDLETLMSEKVIQNGNNFYLSDAMKKLFIALSAKNARDALNPHEFRDIFVRFCPRFGGFRQHDSHEFMRYLLDQIHVEQKKCMKLPNLSEKLTTISYFFEGVLQSRVICLSCKNRSNKNDDFMDLSLDIPFRNMNRLKLADCLNTFFAKELLEKGEKYDCSKCKSKQNVSKQMFVKKLPEILCLHIKRFRDTGGKVDCLIDFPLVGLSMDEFLTEDSEEIPCVYDLTSIIIHIGYGCGSGHYIAFGKRGKNWYQFDDQIAKPCADSIINKQKPYVLLYTKRALKAAHV